MSANKHINVICIVIIAVMILITVLFMFGEKFGLKVDKGTEEEVEETAENSFTKNDKDDDWDTSNATQITLNGDSVSISGNGAYYANNEISIVLPGKYVVSGTLNNGSIKVDADKDDKIWIQFDNVNISCEESAPVNVCQAKKVFITLKADTENTLTFTGSNVETIDGAIYSKDNLTINGDGKLNIVSENYHGIVCNDNLVITGGDINISAKNDGLHANDLIKITDATISIAAGDDGISVSNDETTSYIYIESGNITITECYEGIEANNITIAGGTINIVSSDDGINANGSNSEINISGGDITILNSSGVDADGLDSNGNITITGGKLFISLIGTGSNSAIDYGSESGGQCIINGGTVIACGGSSMAEEISGDSTQGFIMKSVSGQNNTSVIVKDSDGKEIINEEIPYSFSLIIISTPEMSVGDTVTLAVGNSSEEVTIDNTYSGSTGFGGNTGGFGPGGNMPGQNNNQFGGNNDGSESQQTPPQMPDTNSDGSSSGNQQTPPEMPENGFDGNNDSENQQTPPEMPGNGFSDNNGNIQGSALES